jgi:YhcH/YjgK/YiaL family protein
MKLNILIFLNIIIFFLISCKSVKNKTTPEYWSNQQASAWFNQKVWLGQTNLQVDSSLDKNKFALQYYKHKDWWDKAFNFLKNENLMALSVGIHMLDSQNVFVKVSEYVTKNPEKILFETHENYADIHYIVAGKEYIDLALFPATKTIKPYDAEKDIAFFEAKQSKSLLGQPGTAFIIFPNELHRQGVVVEDSIKVKKIVIKIRN